MGDDNVTDLYGSTDFTYGIIILAVAIHITIMAIIFYFVCRNNRCHCCVIHRHDNNITAVMVAHNDSSGTNRRSAAIDSQRLIGERASRTIVRQSSLLARAERSGSVHSQGLPPPYDEASDGAQGEINEGFITVDLPSYEEFAKDNPPKYEQGSPPKYDEVFRPPE